MSTETGMTPRAAAMPRRDALLSVALALFVIAGLLVGAFMFNAARRFTAQTQLPIFPSAEVTAPEGAGPEDGVDAAPGTAPAGAEPGIALPEIVPDESEPAPPEATERLTILLMGIDRREGEEGPFRTDSMILISIDPASNEVAMLSTPRDLMVTIPDFGRGERMERINSAHFYGDAWNYPGGGPALAKATIRRNFGVEVDRHLVLDFDGFRRLIDHIGGVEIDVPAPLVDTQYPTEDYGIMTVRFDAGPQHMDGERALIYSRTRKSTSDFARAERQQQVILAVRDRVLSLGILSSLTPTNVARLIAALDDSVQTDLTLDELLSLVPVARRIDDGGIRRAVIDPNMVREYVTADAAQVLLPRWDVILPLMRETFGVELSPIAAQAPIPPPLPSPTAIPTPQPVAAEARIEIQNASGVLGIEQAMATRLAAEGFIISAIGPAQGEPIARSQIYLYDPGFADDAARLATLVGLSPDEVRPVETGGAGPVIVLILGRDAAGADPDAGG